MTWRYHKDGELDIRTCDICKLSQVKCKDGEWAVYFTYERVEKCMSCWMFKIEESCIHTPEQDSE